MSKQNDKLIAEFVGIDLRHSELPSYSTSYECLMPVLEKICRLKIYTDGAFKVYINPTIFGKIDSETGQIMVRLGEFKIHRADNLLEAIYLAVLEYIDWFNFLSEKSKQEIKEENK